ncbi:hypothetical protein LOZ66_006979, partial [Ophidiomyces ophidiicola]
GLGCGQYDVAVSNSTYARFKERFSIVLQLFGKNDPLVSLCGWRGAVSHVIDRYKAVNGLWDEVKQWQDQRRSYLSRVLDGQVWAIKLPVPGPSEDPPSMPYHYLVRGSMTATEVTYAECYFINNGKTMKTIPRQAYNFRYQGLEELDPWRLFIAEFLHYIPPKCVIAIPASHLCHYFWPEYFREFTYEKPAGIPESPKEEDFLRCMTCLSGNICSILETHCLWNCKPGEEHYITQQAVNKFDSSLRAYPKSFMAFMEWCGPTRCINWSPQYSYTSYFQDVYKMETIPQPWHLESYRCYYLHQSEIPQAESTNIRTLQLEWKVFNENGEPILGSKKVREFHYDCGKVTSHAGPIELLAASAAVKAPPGSVIAIESDYFQPMGKVNKCLLAVLIHGIKLHGTTWEPPPAPAGYPKCTFEFATRALVKLIVYAGVDEGQQLKVLLNESVMRELLNTTDPYFPAYHAQGQDGVNMVTCARTFMQRVIMSKYLFHLPIAPEFASSVDCHTSEYNKPDSKCTVLH